MTTGQEPTIQSDCGRVSEADQSVVRLELTGPEQEALIAVLDNYVSDLRMEIVDTDSTDFKKMLKERKAILMKIVETLRQAPPTTSGDAA